MKRVNLKLLIAAALIAITAAQVSNANEKEANVFKGELYNECFVEKERNIRCLEYKNAWREMERLQKREAGVEMVYKNYIGKTRIDHLKAALSLKPAITYIKGVYYDFYYSYIY